MRNDASDAPYHLAMAWKKDKPAWDLLIQLLQEYPSQREILILLAAEFITDYPEE